eukprot:3521301-Rhodomonas_salina.1
MPGGDPGRGSRKPSPGGPPVMLAVLPFSVMMLTISPADFLHPLCLCVQAVEASPGDVDASPADKEKVFDAVAAAQAEKEKKQAMKEQADARKQEKEMEECTFKPALSRKSLDMLAQVRLFLSSSSPLPRPLFLFLSLIHISEPTRPRLI